MLCTIKLACYFLLYEDLQFMNCNQLFIHYRDTGSVIEKRTNNCNEDQRVPAKIIKSFLSKNDINSARDFVYKMKNRPKTEYTELASLRPPNNVRARIITFYFPQFHEIAENNLWWGNGFTDWTNVKKATPKFTGHYQPHIPHDSLGYYNLGNIEVMKEQTKMAKNHGIYGFTFYFYWFAGKRLLETPLLNYLNSNINFPFCLTWANENWSRRWDGMNHDLLISQKYSETDDILFFEYISKYIKDPRYIKVNEKPLILVYRPSLLPNMYQTAQRWRNYARKIGIGEIYLAYPQSFDTVDPKIYDFDAAIEFPPLNMGLVENKKLVKGLEPKTLNIYDWTSFVKRSEAYSTSSYTIFRGLTPSWDNSPRKPQSGAVMVGSSPYLYGEWLNNAVKYTEETFPSDDEKLVFVNAWNEWGEGAHLEPDKMYGYSWLRETRKIVSKPTDKKIIVVVHDLYRHGAQINALNMVKTLKEKYGYEVVTIAGKDGPMLDDFKRFSNVYVNVQLKQTNLFLQQIVSKKFNHAIVNSCASGWIVSHLNKVGIKTIGLIHEMPQVIKQMELVQNLKDMDEYCDANVFASNIIKDSIEKSLNMKWRVPIIDAQGNYNGRYVNNKQEKEYKRNDLIKKLKITNKDARFIINVGYGDYRKGLDIFTSCAKYAAQMWPFLNFIWVGNIELGQMQSETINNLHFIEFQDNVHDFYMASDFMFLSSREDPFPTVVLESLGAATPVVVVNGTTGLQTLFSNKKFFKILPNSHPETFVKNVEEWVTMGSDIVSLGMDASQYIKSEYGYSSYVGRVLQYILPSTPKISVIVTNHNYKRYLKQRLDSIMFQTNPVQELIFVDDASTDGSYEFAQSYLQNTTTNIKIIKHDEHIGNVFLNWLKGVESSEGDYVWIAEADDSAEPQFLEESVSKMINNQEVVMTYTQSKQMDVDSNIINMDYQYYIKDIGNERWDNDYTRTGMDEIQSGLSVKNVIPNVSGVLFRRDVFLKVLQNLKDELLTFEIAGDWFIYVNILRHGDISFIKKSLNIHRRHSKGKTISNLNNNILKEIKRMQDYVKKEFGINEKYQYLAERYLKSLKEQFHI